MTGRITSLDDPAFQELFDGLTSSWFRLETLQEYDVGYESNEFLGFKTTGRLERELGMWQRMISNHVAAGRVLRRVHVIEEPLTDYLRYELAAYAINGKAGEEIRLVPVRKGTWPDGLPRNVDYWLFDDEDLWSMTYDGSSRFVAAERVDDAGRLTQARQWRDVALERSIPLAAYVPDMA